MLKGIIRIPLIKELLKAQACSVGFFERIYLKSNLVGYRAQINEFLCQLIERVGSAKRLFPLQLYKTFQLSSTTPTVA